MLMHVRNVICVILTGFFLDGHTWNTCYSLLIVAIQATAYIQHYATVYKVS